MRWASIVIGLCACNQVWGIDPTTHLSDASIDAPRLFVPSPAGPPCGQPPAFDSWTFVPHAVDGVGGVIKPSFLAADRVVFMYQTHLYESGLSGGARRLSELEMVPGDGLLSPAAGPNPDTFWFVRQGSVLAGVYVAVRTADGWTQQRADLGITAYQLQPGTVAFYGGSARMVVAVQPTASSMGRLVEVTSDDGLVWTSLGELPFDQTISRYDPALSRDGCFLLFATYGATNETYVSARGGDGVFQPPVLLSRVSSGGDARQAVVDPANTRMWLLDTGGLVEGTP